MRQSSALREPWKRDLGKTCYLPNDLRNRRNLARGGYSSSPVPDLQGQARLRHSFREFLFRGWRRALNLQKLLCLLRDFGQECLKRRRMRCRRLRTSTTYPKRTPGDLRVANRQGSIDAAVMAGPSISRIKKKFFSPPSKCPIDLFGLVANGTMPKRLACCVRVLASVFTCASLVWGLSTFVTQGSGSLQRRPRTLL